MFGFRALTAGQGPDSITVIAEADFLQISDLIRKSSYPESMTAGFAGCSWIPDGKACQRKTVGFPGNPDVRNDVKAQLSTDPGGPRRRPPAFRRFRRG
jgi:hypothetical protein